MKIGINHRRGRRGVRVVSAVACILTLVSMLVACGSEGGATDGDTTPDPIASAPTSDIVIDADTPEGILEALAEYPKADRDAFILERAREEGTVVLYSESAISFLEGRQEAFEAEYPGIEMEFVRVEDPTVGERVRLESEAGENVADIIESGGLEAVVLREDGFVVDHHNVPIPDEYPDLAYGDWWMAHSFNPEVIAWNTNLVLPEDAPTGYDDLLDPKWRNNVAIRDFPDNVLIAMLETRGFDATREWLEQLVVGNEALIRVGSTAGAQLLIAGEFGAHAGILSANLLPLIEDDAAPLDWVFADPFPGGVTPMAISASAPHPYSAILYASFLLSAEGQRSEAANARIVVNQDVPLLYEGYEEMRDALYRGEIILLDPELVARHADDANTLIEEIVTPRFTE